MRPKLHLPRAGRSWARFRFTGVMELAAGEEQGSKRKSTYTPGATRSGGLLFLIVLFEGSYQQTQA